MRRSIREILKVLLPPNFSFDIVIRVHKTFYRNDFNQIKLELEDLVGLLNKWLDFLFYWLRFINMVLDLFWVIDVGLLQPVPSIQLRHCKNMASLKAYGSQ